MNEVPIRYQTNLCQKNTENKISMAILDNRFVNEPVQNELDMNYNKIVNLKEPDNLLDAVTLSYLLKNYPTNKNVKDAFSNQADYFYILDVKINIIPKIDSSQIIKYDPGMKYNISKIMINEKEEVTGLELDHYQNVNSGWFNLMLVRHNFYLKFFEQFDENPGLYMKRLNNLPKVVGTKLKIFYTCFKESK